MIAARLKELRKLHNITQEQLALALAIERSSIGKYESPTKPVTPPPDVLLRIAKYFGVSVDYLMGNISATPKVSESGGVKIPVLGDVAAGIPIEAVENIVDFEEIDATMASSGEYFGLRLKGASMEPRMREGDVVIVRKQEDVETGDTAVVLVNGDSATVKRIKKGPSGITLIPNNPAYDAMFYTNDEIETLPVRILGKVVELRAKF